MWRFDYPAHAGFVAPARSKAELWRLVCGMIMVICIAFFQIALYVFSLQALVADQTLSADAMDPAGSTPASMVISLLTFGLFTIAVFVVTRVLHKRGAMTLFGPKSRVIRQFVMVCLGMFALLAALFILPPWGYGATLIPKTALGTWLLILPLTLFAVLIQTSAEEILFRGYLQQQLAARFKSPLVWMLVPSVMFGALHYDPETAGENALILVVWASLFGLAMADLTARAGSLGPAMAVHFVNNVSAMLFIAVPGFLDGAALYVLPFGMDDTEAMRAWLPVDFALMCISWLVARLAIRA